MLKIREKAIKAIAKKNQEDYKHLLLPKNLILKMISAQK